MLQPINFKISRHVLGISGHNLMDLGENGKTGKGKWKTCKALGTWLAHTLASTRSESVSRSNNWSIAVINTLCLCPSFQQSLKCRGEWRTLLWGRGNRFTQSRKWVTHRTSGIGEENIWDSDIGGGGMRGITGWEGERVARSHWNREVWKGASDRRGA